MSQDAESRRRDAVALLEKFHQGQVVEELWISQAVTDDGQPTGSPRVTGFWPPEIDWPGSELKALWKATCDLVEAKYAARSADGGLAAWLFTRTQQRWMPTGIQARVVDPVGRWLELLRNPAPMTRDVLSAWIVTGNPWKATRFDLQCVAAKAQVLARVWRDCGNKLERRRKSVALLRRDLCKISTLSKGLQQIVRESLPSEDHALRWKERTWNQWCEYAEIVMHYASALIPEELAKCRQLSGRTWQRLEEVDWDSLERELDLLTSKIQWLKVPGDESPERPSKPAKKSPKSSRRKRAKTMTDNEALLAGALTAHHQYSDGECKNSDPIGSNALTRLVGLPQRNGTTFFQKFFRSHQDYIRLCKCEKRLTAGIKSLNGEFRPRDFLNIRTPERVENRTDPGDE